MIIDEIRSSYDKHFQELFSKNQKLSNGNFELFITNVSEDLNLQTTKNKVSENFIIRKIQSTPLLSGGAFLYSIENQLFAFFYNADIGSDGYIEGFISNIPNFKEKLDELCFSFEILKDKNYNGVKMLPADLTSTSLFLFAYANKFVNAPSGSTKASMFLEMMVFTGLSIYKYENKYEPVDLFIEESYILSAAPVLKAYNSGKKKYTREQLVSHAKTAFVNNLKEVFSSKRVELITAFMEYDMDSIFSVVFQKINRLIDTFDKSFLKEAE